MKCIWKRLGHLLLLVKTTQTIQTPQNFYLKCKSSTYNGQRDGGGEVVAPPFPTILKW